MKFCKIRVYELRSDSITMGKLERDYLDSKMKKVYDYYSLGVLDVVTEDFEPNPACGFGNPLHLIPVASTTDSYQIRPKLIKIKSSSLKYGSKKLNSSEILNVMKIFLHFIRPFY